MSNTVPSIFLLQYHTEYFYSFRQQGIIALGWLPDDDPFWIETFTNVQYNITI
jgi:hypothetical protein